METILNNELFALALVGAVAWIGNKVRVWINANIDNKDLANVLTSFSHVGEREVMRLAQTKVKPAKLAGDWNDQMKAAVANEARAAVIRNVPDKVLATAKRLGLDVDELAASTVEAAVPVANNLIGSAADLLARAAGNR